MSENLSKPGTIYPHTKQNTFKKYSFLFYFLIFCFIKSFVGYFITNENFLIFFQSGDYSAAFYIIIQSLIFYVLGILGVVLGRTIMKLILGWAISYHKYIILSIISYGLSFLGIFGSGIGLLLIIILYKHWGIDYGEQVLLIIVYFALIFFIGLLGLGLCYILVNYFQIPIPFL